MLNNISYLQRKVNIEILNILCYTLGIKVYEKGMIIMPDKEKQPIPENNKEKLAENWPEEAVQDILDYIEEQGIYIRE